jgi:hypothetical protein
MTRPAVLAIVALVIAVFGWFVGADRLVANVGLGLCGTAALLVYRREWIKVRTEAHAEFVDAFDWCYREDCSGDSGFGEWGDRGFESFTPTSSNTARRALNQLGPTAKA